MASEDVISERLSRLEKVVNDISIKMDRVLDMKIEHNSSFPSFHENDVPTTHQRRNSIETNDSRKTIDLDSKRSEHTGHSSGIGGGSWIRLYSKKRQEHFLYHSKTEKVYYLFICN